MKNLLIPVLCFLSIQACQQKPAEVAIDKEATKQSVSAVMDKFHSSLKSHNAQQMIDLLADDGVFCGTDPGEVLDKKAFSDILNKALSDSAAAFKYALDKREVRVDDDGNEALVIEQFTMEPFSKRVPTRLVSHVAKKNNDFKVDFFSFSMIPANKDLANLDKALDNLK